MIQDYPGLTRYSNTDLSLLVSIFTPTEPFVIKRYCSQAPPMSNTVVSADKLMQGLLPALCTMLETGFAGEIESTSVTY